VANLRRALVLGSVLTLAVTGCQGGSAEPAPPPPAVGVIPPPATTAATEGAGELANATVAVLWSPDTCTGEPLRYVDGQHEIRRASPDGSTEVWVASIVATARADVDHDGTDEFVVKSECAREGGRHNVVAIRPDGTGGWAPLGLVVGESTEIPAIGDVAVTSSGEVVVSVGSGPNYSLLPYDMLNLPTLWQPRTYAWTGQAFAQAGGPTTFAADPTVAAFTVQAAPVALSQSGDFWDSTITVTVRADGPQAVAARLAVAVAGERRPVGDWARCGPGSDDNRAVCDLGVMAAGSTVTLRLPIRTAYDQGLQDGHIAIVAIQTDQSRYEPVAISVASS